MATHVTIAEAQDRLPELVAAAMRGEDVVFDEAGVPVVRLVVDTATADARERRAAKRRAAFGMFKDAFAGYDTSVTGLKVDRVDSDRRWTRKEGDAGLPA